jgi:2-phosphosulfolactate phosphatase
VRVEVFFGASSMTSADVHGRVVVVLDVLRASTTIVVALSNGARAIIPFESAEEAITRSKSFERSEVMLAGERKMHTIPGFDLGNSPGEFTRDAVEGRTLLFTTSNGTGALVAVQNAREVLVGSFVNFSVTAAMLRAAVGAGSDVTIVAAGREKHFALEDATCAGRFVRALSKGHPEAELNDGATAAVLMHRRYGGDLQKLFADAQHGRALAEAGFEGDLALCAAIDSHPVIPVYQDRQITRLGHERER